MADAELRAWKIKAHAALDPLWRGNRSAGYRWLARRLGIAAAECHIGLFDVETCQRVIEVCSNQKARR
jgi:hypothetical protein